MARLNIERQKELEPIRMAFAIKHITERGFTIIDQTGNRIQFMYNGQKVTLYPYSGYFSGKSVHAGRGIADLLCQLKK